MPTVSLARDELFARLGRTYTKEEFEGICFDFGIELDEETTEQEQVERMMGTDAAANAKSEILYKIEVPANRYDLLCMEGMSQALNVFLGNTPIPNFHYSNQGKKTKLEKITVSAETLNVRPFVVCAIIRNVTLTESAYESFLELQKKLHQGVCRERKLVAIGTHDLDKVEGPFTYEALAPNKITFAPLKFPDKNMDANQLFEFINKTDVFKELRPYLPIISSSPVYPVILDAKKRVLSLPPIINGDHSKISPATKNVFIECTATDLTKAHIVLDTLVAAFSEYAKDKFSVEQVEVVYPDNRANKNSVLTPDLTNFEMNVSVDYINKGIGNLPSYLDAERIQTLLKRMMITSEIIDDEDSSQSTTVVTDNKKKKKSDVQTPTKKSENEGNNSSKKSAKFLKVHIPISRSDILHSCDIVEDVAIAYGFNNVPTRFPNLSTNAKQFPINHLSDKLRREMAQAGYMEILTMALLSREETYELLLKENDGSAVELANPASQDFQVCRTSLLPGMLKTLAANIETKKPLQLFECSDVVLIDPATDTGARNERRLVVVYQDTNTAGFQFVHGMLDRLMVSLAVSPSEYSLVPSNDPSFFAGQQATIVVRGKEVGQIGVIHPQVLLNFINNTHLCCPASALEINLEHFL
eukprot:c20841_g1_i2.p1 GENE.c20841_g1_i2~~c20841_g1_i2.p1  ORF type:complete len:642 (-),score=298.90 c20841_g1_i2:12-1937(-)